MAEPKEKRQPASPRHRLLFYQRAMDRVWVTALMLAVLMVALRYLPHFKVAVYEPLIYLNLLTIGAVAALAVAVLALLARGLGYVQARESYLLVATPFLRLKISYQRLLTAKPAGLGLVYQNQKLGWGRQSFLEPFMGKTAVLLDLKSFPVSPAFLRLFLLPVMFQPRNNGLILVVKDWMGLITEIDSQHSAWKYRSRNSQPGQRGRGR